MTLIDLRTIPETGRSYRFEVEPQTWTAVGGEEGTVELAGPLAVEADVLRVGARIVLNGRISGGLRLRCDRCLNAFRRDVDITFRTHLTIPGDSDGEADVELADEDMEVDFVAGGEVEILDLVRDQLFLNQPIKNLCSQNCKGLCNRCGSDLNTGPCGCPPEEVNPAFQKLRALKPGGGKK
jgi:uncharacterized protein